MRRKKRDGQTAQRQRRQSMLGLAATHQSPPAFQSSLAQANLHAGRQPDDVIGHLASPSR